MTQQTITLIATIVGPIVTIVVVYLTSRFAFNRERRLVSWKREIERFLELEEFVGEIVEDVGAYKPDSEGVVAQMDKLSTAAGRFRRYKSVTQSLRDLHSTLGRLILAKRKHSDDEPATRDELEARFEEFINACDSIIGIRL